MPQDIRYMTIVVDIRGFPSWACCCFAQVDRSSVSESFRAPPQTYDMARTKQHLQCQVEQVAAKAESAQVMV
jgi:hypothetical protein